MADLIITNCDTTPLEVAHNEALDIVKETFTAAGADTFKKGTILARDSVSGKLVVFAKGGSTNENGIPKMILTAELVAAGAGDSAVAVFKSGRFNKNQLVIHADGDASNIDAVVEDQMRDFTFMADTFNDISVLDNQ